MHSALILKAISQCAERVWLRKTTTAVHELLDTKLPLLLQVRGSVYD